MTPSRTAPKKLGRNPFAAREASARPVATKSPAPGPRKKLGARAGLTPRKARNENWLAGLRYLIWGGVLAGLRFMLAPRAA